jgi:predicted O-methyltransferase YrrM
MLKVSLAKNRGPFGLLAEDLRRAVRIIDPMARKPKLFRVSLFQTSKLFNKNHDKIFTHLSIDERLVLFVLASDLKRGAIVAEIGSFLGASACYLARGLAGKGKVYCIDTWNNDAMDEPKRDTYAEFQDNIADLTSAVVPLRGLSHEVAVSFDKQIDLLFIDGDHSYQSCLLDWWCWRTFLKKDAIVVFHDSGWAEGVKKVIRDEVTPQAKRQLHMPNMYVAWL